MINTLPLNKVMFYVGSLESDFKSPTATGRILNMALVLADNSVLAVLSFSSATVFFDADR